MRPWYLLPERSNATAVTPALFAFSAMRLPITAAAAALPGYADRPAFIGWGLKDFVFDRHFLAGFRAALPRAEVHAFEDANHYVLEDKHEVLVPAIRKFLDTHPL